MNWPECPFFSEPARLLCREERVGRHLINPLAKESYMDTSTKGTKGPRRKEQSGPRIFERIGSRAERNVPMSAKTARVLDQYVDWAADLGGADKGEVTILTLDMALGEFFAKDALFQESLAKGGKGSGGRTTGLTAAGG